MRFFYLRQQNVFKMQKTLTYPLRLTSLTVKIGEQLKGAFFFLN